MILLGFIVCIVWLALLEMRVRTNKEDNDDHNAKIARHEGRIKKLEIYKDTVS